MTEKKRFNSFLDPIRVEPPDLNIETIEEGILLRDENGHFVLQKSTRNIQEEIQQDRYSSQLPEQLKRLAAGTQKPLPEQTADISNLPDNLAEAYQLSSKNQERLNKAKEALQKAGITEEELLNDNFNFDDFIAKKVDDILAKNKIQATEEKGSQDE